MNIQFSLQNYKNNLNSLGVYRSFLKDDVFQKLYSLIEYLNINNCDIFESISKYNEFYNSLLENTNSLCFKRYIIEKIIYSENAFSIIAQTAEFTSIPKELINALGNDLKSLQNLSTFSNEILLELLKDNANYELLKTLPTLVDKVGIEADIVNKFYSSSSWAELTRQLADFHKKNGIGIFSKFKGFVWEGDILQGVVSLDPITLDQLVNYDYQKETVVRNTQAFLKGYKANNILLYGSRGTGKSSTVKALLNEFYNDGLRVIEIPKQFLNTFPKLIRLLKESPLKFILFIDDLAFEDNEETYTALKAILEGGLETKPQNVIIYATSNRRHLIKEKFSDRAGLSSSNPQDEIHAMDSIEEKLSLADRFGITVTYLHPDQKEYLSIIDTLAKQRGLDIPQEILHRRALQWELSYNGRSPRTARQFIDYLESELKGTLCKK